MSVLDFNKFKKPAPVSEGPPTGQPPQESRFAVYSLEAGPSLVLTRDLFDLIVIKLAFPEDAASGRELAEALVKAAYGEGAVLPTPPV